MKLSSRIVRTLKNLKGDVSGATAIEYGVIGAGVSILILAGVQIVGPQVKKDFDEIGAKIEDFTKK